MIDPKELRIGNLVGGQKGETIEVDATLFVADMDPDGYFDLSDCTPIPITAEWLERLGFELKNPCGDEGFIKWKHKDGVYLLWIDGKFWHDYWSTGIWINSIHQLQNLYHALTGQELTVK